MSPPVAPVTPIVIQAAPAVVAAPAAAPPISGWTSIFGVNVNPMLTALIVVFALVAFLLWKGQRDSGKNSFDIWDLLMERQPDGHRLTSSTKTLLMGAFVVSTWLLIDQEIRSSPLLVPLFYGYMGTWGAALIAAGIFGQKTMPTFNLPGAKKDD